MPIYEFTCVLTQHEVEKWYAWFAGRGIPVAMVEHTEKKIPERFAVWRALEDRLRSEPWKKTYRIVKSANGFTKEV